MSVDNSTDSGTSSLVNTNTNTNTSDAQDAPTMDDTNGDNTSPTQPNVDGSDTQLEEQPAADPTDDGPSQVVNPTPAAEQVDEDPTNTAVQDQPPQPIEPEEEIQLPPAASPNLSTVCSYDSLSSSGTSAGVACFQLCQKGICCSEDSASACLGDGEVSMEALDNLNAICRTYQPCEYTGVQMIITSFVLIAR